MTKKEIWRKTHNVNYEVSNLGRVRSIDRYVNNPIHGMILLKGRILKQHDDKNGYLRVALGAGSKRYKVARLVAAAFFGKIDDGLVVDHINGIRSDNRVENLRIISQHLNCIVSADRRKRMPDSHVNYILKHCNSKSQSAIANDLSISQSTVSRIINNQRRQYNAI